MSLDMGELFKQVEKEIATSQAIRRAAKIGIVFCTIQSALDTYRRGGEGSNSQYAWSIFVRMLENGSLSEVLYENLDARGAVKVTEQSEIIQAKNREDGRVVSQGVETEHAAKNEDVELTPEMVKAVFQRLGLSENDQELLVMQTLNEKYPMPDRDLPEEEQVDGLAATSEVIQRTDEDILRENYQRQVREAGLPAGFAEPPADYFYNVDNSVDPITQ